MNNQSVFKTNVSNEAFQKPSVKFDDLNKSIASKLISSSSSNFSNSNENIEMPNIAILQKIANLNIINSKDAKSLIQLLPDIESSIKILTSLVLSPKDLKTVELTFKVNSNVFKNESTSLLLKLINDYFINVYKIKEILEDIIRESLFEYGSYSLLVLPESSIDDIINSNSNVSLEKFKDFDLNGHFNKSKGILKNPTKQTDNKQFNFISFESFNCDYDHLINSSELKKLFSKIGGDKNSDDQNETFGLLSFIDNEEVLKIPFLQNKINNEKIKNLYSNSLNRKHKISTEDKNKDEEKNKITNRYFKPRPGLVIPTPKQLKKENIGQPLVIRLPAESVIPIHEPSNPSKHLGYCILIDENGNPINNSNQEDFFNDLSNSFSKSSSAISQTIQTVNRYTNGFMNSNNFEKQELFKTYSKIIEKEILARLNNGVFNEKSATAASATDAYRVMFSRSLMRMNTRLLYVPSCLMTYFAFNYNDYGIGESLIQKAKITLGIRSVLLFNDTIAHIKNSINQTTVSIELDPRDPTPQKTVEFLLNEQAKISNGAYPLGITNPVDIISYLQNSSINYQISGNTKYPSTKVDVQHKNPTNAVVDQDLSNSLRDATIRAFGLTPEIVVSSQNADFAIELVTKNINQQKTANLIREKLLNLLTDFVRKYILNHGELINKLREIIKNNDNLKENSKEIIDKKNEYKEEDRAADAKGGNSEIPSYNNKNITSNESITYIKKTGINLLDTDLFDKEKKELPDSTEEKNEDQYISDEEIDVIVEDFINSIVVSLPSYDNDVSTIISEEIDNRSKLIDSILPFYIDSTFLDNSQLGNMTESIEPIKAAIKALLMRNWIRTTGVLPDLDKLISVDEHTGKPYDLLEDINIYLNSVSNSLQPLMEEIVKNKKERDLKYNGINETTSSNDDEISTDEIDITSDNEEIDTSDEIDTSNDDNEISKDLE